ncbi:hypothetical protein [Streptomyces sp. NPDC002516]
MMHMEKVMVPRQGLRIDLTLRELPFPLIGLGGAGLGVRAGTNTAVIALAAFLVSIRVRISRI